MSGVSDVNFMKIINKLLKIIYPPVCLFCEAISDEPVCSKCAGKISYISEPRCKKCGKPVRSVQQEYCRDCREVEKIFECGRNLWLHRGGVSDSLYRFKYHNRRINRIFYAEELQKYYGDLIQQWQIEQIIPIPLHWRRKMQRGYNQAELIAKELGIVTGIPVNIRSLIRSKSTVRQKVLSVRERKNNLKGAFQSVHSEELCGRVLLIDDIYTTGSTLDEAAKCLKNAGVRKVYFLTISIGQGI